MAGLESAEEILDRLRTQADPANVEGMARYGISAKGTLGVPVPAVRAIAKQLRAAAGRGDAGLVARHDVAAELWGSGVHEARILAAFVDVPALVDRAQAERWVLDVDSWDVCDQTCSNLFDRTDFAYELAAEWPQRDEEFVRRAGFVMMAALAVHDKAATDEAFLAMLPLIERHSTDERNFVKKAVNWALRQIGKRDLALNRAAIDVAARLSSSEDRTAKWIGRDAERELRSPPVQRRLIR
jgi:3-methyladenine DNA glycosylase AlkD